MLLRDSSHPKSFPPDNEVPEGTQVCITNHKGVCLSFAFEGQVDADLSFALAQTPSTSESETSTLVRPAATELRVETSC